jgi:hypothetical protein
MVSSLNLKTTDFVSTNSVHPKKKRHLTGNIPQELLQNWKKLGRLLPKRAMLTSLQFNTLATPEISILESLDR